MEKVLTISVAAYNVGKYIRQTLDSLLVPELLNELEVFVIDDGGQDETFSIAKEYEEAYPGTFYAIHKENGGYGTTVNWSVEHATGKYFKLLDGDDWFDKDGLCELVACMRTSDAELLISNAARAQEGYPTKEMYPHCRKVDGQTIMIAKAASFPVVAMWACAFRLDIIRKTFQPLLAHTLYTDQIFVIRALKSVVQIEFVGKIVYYWRLGRNEQSNSVNSIRKHYREIIDVADIISNYYHEMTKENLEREYPYQLKRAAAYYSVSVSMLCKLEHTYENLKIIKQWEKQTKHRVPEVYRAAGTAKKLWLLRATGYLIYWLY